MKTELWLGFLIESCKLIIENWQSLAKLSEAIRLPNSQSSYLSDFQ